MSKAIEEKQVRLRDNPFLLSLVSRGLTFQDYSPNAIITVVAVEGEFEDWTAYFETPESVGIVAEMGAKLPETVAKELFPDWAKRLKWRP
jgi:hypothetical protein